MVRRKRDVAIIVLRCVIFGFCASAQHAASGTGMAAPSKPADGGYVLVAQADTPAEPQVIVQETKNADAPAKPQAEMREIKSAARLSKSKQRRRKPKMAGVPAGSQVVALETKEPELQVAAKGTKVPVPQAVAMEAKKPEAQVAEQETEETATLDKPLAGTQETKNANVAVKPREEEKKPKVEVADVGKKKYGMAPIQWGVRLTETLGKNKITETFHGVKGSNIGTGSSSTIGFINTQTVDAGAKTYILQPYIAQLDGSLSLVHSRGAINDIAGQSNSVSADSSLSLFPQSRFPFTMYAGIGKRNNNSNFNEQDSKSNTLSLRQIYRPLSGFSNYNGGYKRTTDTINQNSASVFGGERTKEVITRSFWDGGYSTRSQVHRTNVAVTLNDKQYSTLTNINKRTDHLAVTDVYLPTDSLLSVNSFVNLDLFSENLSSIRYILANSSIAWQPEAEEIPLFVDGNVHLFDQHTTLGNASSKTRSLGGDFNAKYLFSKNLTGYASGGVDSTVNNGKQAFTTRQGGSAIYLSDVAPLWKNAAYSWNARAGATNLTGSKPDSSVLGGVGHGLNAPYLFDILGKKMQSISRINQSLTTEFSRIKGQTTTFDNIGSVSATGSLASGSKNIEYGRTYGGATTGVVLSVFDRHIYGKTPSHTRVSSLSLILRETSQTAYSRPGLTVDVALEAQQGTGGGGLRLIGRSNATYVKSNIFGVRGLSYVGALTIDKRSDTIAADDLNANNPWLPWELDQRLRYRIGQNELVFRANVADKYGVKNSSLWLVFKAWRTIGNAS